MLVYHQRNLHVLKIDSVHVYMHTDQYVSLTALPLESFLFDCISLDAFQVGLQILCYDGSKQNNLEQPFNFILNTSVSFNTQEIPMIVTNQ